MAAIDRAVNIDDLAAIAKRRMPLGLYEFIDRGAEDEITLGENSASIKRIFLRQRVGVDVSARDFSMELFGVRHSMPLGIGVAGLSGMLSYDGERSLARAATKAGVSYTIGSGNFTSVEELKEICGDLLWRQIYPPKRRDVLDHHLAVTRRAGVRVLVITMDSPVLGNREYMIRNGFMPGYTNARTIREMLTAPRWTIGTLLRHLLSGGLPSFADMPENEKRFFGQPSEATAIADDFTWQDVREVRRKWKDVLVLKGLSTMEDARIAADCGVDGIIVSNHGGRVLDGCVPSMDVLPQIADAVGSRLTVMVDGGFRRGADILKAVAAGASSVMLGRAPIFGLTAGGEAGVSKALEILRGEISRALALCGGRNLSELDSSILDNRGPA